MAGTSASQSGVKLTGCAARDRGAEDDIGVARQEFRDAVHHDIGAKAEGSLSEGRRERVVDCDENLVTLRACAGADLLFIESPTNQMLEVADIPAADARNAREMVLLGSSVKVAPIVAWDGRPIGDGRPGPAAAALLALIDEDMRSSDRLIDVPYVR